MITVTKAYSSPTLYKTTSSGSLRQWRVWSSGADVYTEHGQVGGKLQISKDTVKGKSKGRSNETTAEQQAALDAEHLRDAYIKRGYSETRGAAEKTTNALPAILPMLAHVYEDVKDPIYPAYVQPKLDGVRCLAVVRDGKCTLYTRSQKVIDTVPHVVAAIERISKLRKAPNFVLDGELYNHELKGDFNRILGAIKRKGVGEDSHLVYYYVYDLPSHRTLTAGPLSFPFSHRIEVLTELIGAAPIPLVVVDTILVTREDDMRELAAKFMRDGYEGAMYRSTSGYYEGKRSRHLLKVKTMRDGEFEVVGYTEGRGKLMGKVGAWVCKTKDRVEFKAKMEGSLDDLPPFGSADANSYIGQFLTVRYQGLTPDGSLRFPVGVKFKDEVEK